LKKYFKLFSILFLFCLTGCSINKMSSVDIGNNIKEILSNNTSIFNSYYEGYKYYLPHGLVYLDKDEYNSLFRDKNDNRYYLYVDVVGYYYKIEDNYEENDKAHYSNILNYNNKYGYIEINKYKGKYFIEYVYNYGKIEVLCSKDDLVNVINNSSIILNSINYNRKVIDSMIGNSALKYKEEEFTLFDDDENNKEDFMDVVEKYEDKAYKKAKDEEKIEINISDN